jgi:hypothetical protein
MQPVLPGPALQSGFVPVLKVFSGSRTDNNRNSACYGHIPPAPFG